MTFDFDEARCAIISIICISSAVVTLLASAGRLREHCPFEGRACDAMMDTYYTKRTKKPNYYCKYIGSSRLGSHSFERFGLQGFSTFDAQQAVTPASAPLDNTTAPAAPHTRLRRVPQRVRKGNPTGLNVFYPKRSIRGPV